MDVWSREQLGSGFIRQTKPEVYFLLSPKISGGYRAICPVLSRVGLLQHVFQSQAGCSSVWVNDRKVKVLNLKVWQIMN